LVTVDARNEFDLSIRSARWRLRALWQHAPYFHDGSAATLADVVAHYNRVRNLGLTTDQQRDLVEYLKSL
jgi:cytochrome c peroxidase